MRTMPRFTAAALALLLAAGSAAAQAPKSAQERQAILDYQLTMPRATQLLDAVPEMTRYVASRPDAAERIRRSMQMTLAERRAAVERDAGATAILQRHGLTAQEYLVGVPTLRMALMAAQGGAGLPNVVASPANVAFAKAHLAELKPRMDAADGARRP